MAEKLKLTVHRKNALTLMLEVARQGGETPVSLSAVAEATGFSVPYLEILAADMRRAGLISGFRGPSGGYQLAKPASTISVLDIVRSTREGIHGRSKKEDGIVPSGARRGQNLWDKLEVLQYLLLQRISLAEILDGSVEAHPVLERIRNISRPTRSNSAAE